jgi:hypothetical protein
VFAFFEKKKKRKERKEKKRGRVRIKAFRRGVRVLVIKE